MTYEGSIENRIVEDVCCKYGLDQELFFKRAKMLLEACRKNHMTQLLTLESGSAFLFDIAGTSLVELLEKLQTYLKDQNSNICFRDIKKLMKSGWMSSLIRNTMDYLRCLPEWGIGYAEILEAAFFSGLKMQSKELMDLFDMDESCFFRKKREAVEMFGIILVEKTLPHLIDTIKDEMSRIVRENSQWKQQDYQQLRFAYL